MTVASIPEPVQALVERERIRLGRCYLLDHRGISTVKGRLWLIDFYTGSEERFLVALESPTRLRILSQGKVSG
jgi:hypothetical protein